mgnify:CR=1 FL=1
MTQDNAIVDHYSQSTLMNKIEEALHKLNLSKENIAIGDLSAVDEFHIGGIAATEHLFSALNFNEGSHVLDVGCGIGGTARFVANKYNNQVTGVDLTEEFVQVGNTLSKWVNMEQSVKLHQASALSLPFDDDHFDGSFMVHVGMNIEDKNALFKEVHRVLRPGATYGIYDIMRSNNGDLAYPVPWATVSDTSKLCTVDQYEQALEQAGFKIIAQNNRHEFALAFFEQVRAKTAANGGPPPLGIHTIIGENAAVKIKNMMDNVSAGLIAPIEIVAAKV